MTKNFSVRLLGSLVILGFGVVAGCGIQDTSLSSPAPHHRVSKTIATKAPPLAQAKSIQMTSSHTGWADSPHQIFRTTTSEKKWFSVLKSPTILAMDTVNSNTAWVISQDSARHITLSHTNDGGVHWSSSHLIAPWPVVQASVTTSPSGSSGSVLLTGPVGTQTGPQSLWTISHDHVSSDPLYSTENGSFSRITWTSSTKAWALSYDASAPVLMISTNHGASWTPVVLPLPTWVSAKVVNNPNPKPRAVVLASQPPIFVLGSGFLSTTLSVPYITPQNIVDFHNYAVLYHTTNGTTWTPIWTHPNSSLISMDWATAQNGWALVTKGHQVQLDYTSTAGRTWKTVSILPKTMHPLSLAFFDHTGWIVSQSPETNTLSLWQSQNEGQQWQVVPEKPVLVPATHP